MPRGDGIDNIPLETKAACTNAQASQVQQIACHSPYFDHDTRDVKRLLNDGARE
jgi:hypothetical protein